MFFCVTIVTVFVMWKLDKDQILQNKPSRMQTRKAEEKFIHGDCHALYLIYDHDLHPQDLNFFGLINLWNQAQIKASRHPARILLVTL